MTPRWLAIVHRLPERTRLRAPLLRRDDAACERVAEALAAIPGVREVGVKPYTGSVLILHDETISFEVVIEEAQRVLGVTQVLSPGEPAPYDGEVPALATVARQMVDTFRELDKELRRNTDGTLDLGTLTTLGFVAAGALEIVATGTLPMPAWFNFAWWGFRTFVTAEGELLSHRESDPRIP